MSYTIIKTNDAETWIKLSGVLTVADFQVLQQMGKKGLETRGCFHALIELDDFQGWSKDTAGWEETSFLIDGGDRAARIAVVGDERWKEDVLLFLGQPFRNTAIAFFRPHQLAEAQAWLSATGNRQSVD